MKRISVLILSLLIAQSQALYCNALIDNIGVFTKLFEAGGKATFFPKETKEVLGYLVMCTYLVKFGHKFMKEGKITRVRQEGLFSNAGLDVACGALSVSLLLAMTANAGIKYKKSVTRNPEANN